MTSSGPEPSRVFVRLGAEHHEGAGLRVAGLTVVERAVKQLRRKGHEPVLIVEGDLPLPAGVPADVRVQRVQDADGVHTPAVDANVVRLNSEGLEQGRVVNDEASREAAEDAIFADLLRGDLGFVARHLNKPISFRITRHFLCHLPVTPNQVTIGAALIGLVGAVLIATGQQTNMVWGLLLAHLQSVLDGCDGELARVRFQQSAIGEWLDTAADDFMNLALMGALGLGLQRATGQPLYLVAGAVGCAMLLVYNVVAYRELARQGEGGEVLKVRWWFQGGRNTKEQLGSPGGLARSVGLLIRRDFFILCWLLLGVAGLVPVALLWAFLIALTYFVGAVGQVVWRAAGRG